MPHGIILSIEQLRCLVTLLRDGGSACVDALRRSASDAAGLIDGATNAGDGVAAADYMAANVYHSATAQMTSLVYDALDFGALVADEKMGGGLLGGSSQARQELLRMPLTSDGEEADEFDAAVASLVESSQEQDATNTAADGVGASVAMAFGALALADGDVAPPATAPPKPEVVQLVCNLLCRLDAPIATHSDASDSGSPRVEAQAASATGSLGSRDSLVGWMQRELALAKALGAEGIALSAQLRVAIDMLTESSSEPSSNDTEVMASVEEQIHARQRKLMKKARVRRLSAIAVRELRAATRHANRLVESIHQVSYDGIVRRVIATDAGKAAIGALKAARDGQSTSTASSTQQPNAGRDRSPSDCITAAAKAMDVLSQALHQDPAWKSATEEQQAACVTALERLLGRLSLAGSVAACARPTADAELHTRAFRSARQVHCRRRRLWVCRQGTRGRWRSARCSLVCLSGLLRRALPRARPTLWATAGRSSPSRRRRAHKLLPPLQSSCPADRRQACTCL